MSIISPNTMKIEMVIGSEKQEKKLNLLHHVYHSMEKK